MLELYFLIYRIPKMMTRLARERNRSALAWSLMGVGAWLGAELFVLFGAGLIYGTGSVLARLRWVRRILRSRLQERRQPLQPPRQAFKNTLPATQKARHYPQFHSIDTQPGFGYSFN